MDEACLYTRQPDRVVQCHLCSHRCTIKPGRRGICSVRENRDGTLCSLVYGKVIARHIDPVEKKPMFHFMPGSLSCSIATVGCNFKCRFCQNADIAQLPADREGIIIGNPATPGEIVTAAKKGNCATIAYTYTEPTIYFEFACDTAKLAHENGIRNIFVSNGYMTPEAVEMIGPWLDGANIDLKAYSDAFYRSRCGARLEPVKETLKRLKAADVFVEVTTLVIPGLNDNPAELGELARFLVEELGPETPWHISRFHPTYRMTDREATPVKTLMMAREIGSKAGLRYVYTGNIPGQGGEDTTCYQCGETLVERWGFTVRNNRITGGKCPDCGAAIDGVGL